MELREIGRSGVRVGAVALGTMNFGADWHGVGALDEKTARDLVDIAAERGVNLLDTADIYGHGAAEAMLGKILAGRRARFVLATKVLGRMRPGEPSSGGLSARHIAEGLDESLWRLRTDYVDLYMCHDSDPRVPVEESHEAFDRAVRAGKVRVLGVSNLPRGELTRWTESSRSRGWAPVQFDQVQYSLAAPSAGADLLPVCRGGAMSLLAWSPLGGGLLTGKYAGTGPRPAGRRRDPAEAFPSLPERRLGGLVRVLGKVARLEGVTPAQAALGWVLGHRAVAAAVVGARTREQLAENLGARTLSARAQDFLDRASRL